MRLWTLSDLHQEHVANAWDPAAHVPAGGFDAVVIAGDVQVPLVRSLEWIAAERFHGVPVVYVPGNHDFWWDRGEVRYTLSDQVRLGRAAADRLGVHLLMDDAVTIGGVTFVGATLWTDFRLGAFGLLHGLRSAGGREGMQDYRRIRTGPTSRHRIEPEDVLRLHRASRAYVQGAIRPAPERTVVVTHHAPSRRSLSPHENLAWCYATDLDDLIGTCRPPYGSTAMSTGMRITGSTTPASSATHAATSRRPPASSQVSSSRCPTGRPTPTRSRERTERKERTDDRRPRRPASRGRIPKPRRGDARRDRRHRVPSGHAPGPRRPRRRGHRRGGTHGRRLSARAPSGTVVPFGRTSRAIRRSGDAADPEGSKRRAGRADPSTGPAR